jgi:hypothetical protein
MARQSATDFLFHMKELPDIGPFPPIFWHVMSKVSKFGAISKFEEKRQ